MLDGIYVDARDLHSIVIGFSVYGDDQEWVKGEGWLGSLMPIRATVAQGDHEPDMPNVAQPFIDRDTRLRSMSTASTVTHTRC